MTTMLRHHIKRTLRRHILFAMGIAAALAAFSGCGVDTESSQTAASAAGPPNASFEPPDAPPAPARKTIVIPAEFTYAAFPWPPPSGYMMLVLPSSLYRKGLPRAPTLGDLGKMLESALAAQGYTDHTFYYVPGGFALATRIEHTDNKGYPLSEPSRFLDAPARMWQFAYWNELIGRDVGHWRMIVFIVSSEPFTRRSPKMSESDAHDLLNGGENQLSPKIASLPLTNDHRCSALVYEFVKVHRESPGVLEERFGAEVHLERSGILGRMQAYSK